MSRLFAEELRETGLPIEIHFHCVSVSLEGYVRNDDVVVNPENLHGVVVRYFALFERARALCQDSVEGGRVQLWRLFDHPPHAIVRRSLEEGCSWGIGAAANEREDSSIPTEFVREATSCGYRKLLLFERETILNLTLQFEPRPRLLVLNLLAQGLTKQRDDLVDCRLTWHGLDCGRRKHNLCESLLDLPLEENRHRPKTRPCLSKL